jgi:hypothetical protein
MGDKFSVTDNTGGNIMEPVSAGIMVGGQLISGLLGQKAQAERERRKMILEALQSGSESARSGLQSMQQGQAQALTGAQNMLTNVLR